jgi:NAD(P)H dehydrogenase (quinone)
MILVTGATGQFGNAAINFLLQKGVKAEQIVALVRSEAGVAAMNEKGIRSAIGDYNDYTSLANAFNGVEKLLFVSGSDIGQRLTQHHNVISAASEAGVKHVVYTSFQRKNETETSPLWIVANSHLQTEALLKASGMDYTILKNNLYMDFIPAFVGEHVLQTGLIYLPAGSGKVAAVLRSEMAEATATVLTTPNHEGKEYDFTHSEAVSYQDVAQFISERTGQVIRYVSPTAAEYAETLAKYQVPNEVIGLFSGFAVAQAQGELDVVSHTLEELLGRKPTSVRAFLNQIYS